MPGPSPTAPGFDGEAAYQFDRALAGQIGSRPGGSAAFDEAAAYIMDQLKGMGYDVALQRYPVTTFRERSTTLLLIRPEQIEVKALALAYSGSGEVTGQLLYCGMGRPQDFPAAGAQGKIALIDRGEITFQSKVDAAVARGASGVIVANDREGEVRGSLSRAGRVPAVTILRADGQKLKEMIRQGQTQVTLAVDAEITTREGQNVVATSRGSAPGGKKIVIGAHYDTVSTAPGANDNGSGVSVMLELARETRGRNYPFDLTFVAFGDEEIGLVGSKSYVESLSKQDRDQIAAMLNFDMVGVGTAMEFDGDKGLVTRAMQIAEVLGYRTQPLAVQANQSSDHASFVQAGIPALFFYRAEDPNYHTSLDTLERVSAANLKAAGDVAMGIMDSLAKR